MKRFVVLLMAIVFQLSQVAYEAAGEHEIRANDVVEKFVLSGGTNSRLFGECALQANTVEGSLYSFTVEGKTFVRYAPAVSRDMLWTSVEITGQPGIIQCAIKASELQARMLKYEGGQCRVSITDAYDHTQAGCDGPEIVYINLAAATCKEEQFRCSSSGVCIDAAKKCDKVPDCASGEDEAGCASTCGPQAFQCAWDGIQVCFPISVKCDSIVDCDSGEDEADCA